MPDPEKQRSTAIIILRGGILLLAFAMVILFLTLPSWFRPFFDKFLQWAPYPKVTLPLMAMFGFPLLLAMIQLGVGTYPFTPIGLVQALLMETVDLYSDLMLTLLVVLPVGVEVFLILTGVFEAAMTIAGLVWGYRWLMGEFKPVFNTGTLWVLLVYIGLLGFLLLVFLKHEWLVSKQKQYLDFVHGIRRKAMEKVTRLNKRL